MVLGLGAALLALQGASAVQTPEAMPRGLRNHNPGNIRDTRDTWVGEIGRDAGGYVIFDADEHGLRAMAIVLLSYQSRHGIHTIRGIVQRYAPALDGNNEAAYVAHICAVLGLGADEPFAIDVVLPELMAVMIAHENGANPYSMAMIERAVSTA